MLDKKKGRNWTYQYERDILLKWRQDAVISITDLVFFFFNLILLLACLVANEMKGETCIYELKCMDRT